MTAQPKADVMPPRPTQIKLKKAEKQLDITFDDGAAFSYPAELLRVESPSAEVQGHGASQKKLSPDDAMLA